MDISYIINELAEDRENYFNAVAPPIMQSSNFAFKKVNDMRQAFADEYSAFLYSRGLNPTVDILRKKLAALDAAEDCLVFNSGVAAIFAAVLANVKAGDHIVSVDKPYAWAQKMFNVILPRFGVTTSYIDGREIENFERAILPNTTVIYLESPNSWDYALQDLSAVAELARSKNIITICDNSYCTPIYQRPVEMGIDLVLQSATKYISGHSDVVAGVLSGRKEMITKIFNSEYMNIGSGIQPFNAWLLIRGLRTLPVRLEHITKTTHTVLSFLKKHPQVESVIFPFDEDFPQLELAKKQMNGVCGLLTFVIKADNVLQVERFCENLRHILMAVSWGGHESLIIPKCSGMQRSFFKAENPDHRMLRLYVGLEDADYLIKDLERGFDSMNNS
ncbi:PLP-dependent aspartate aminotransferase family protein [Ferruginibacter sp. HRS2-29]|uniref:trans-sulfuration enzyme family protein n=1 Tax=Ferruginibacter sp. HRS2-29 TaxID=2487334 RepID=UPI0020CE8E8F|nr:aminotransferase class I/II-fold pyridoxal phosphate-dependent enzyme [Ferruginibacter sp. HRS2-29]MCP9749972.1 aminotransferase class I/II-fold pyridoxal phosphate-dependent enzyme [Ferruginibacter sp. HRS2-29]